MALRTRKWGYALSITLLIAAPVVLAVWIGQALMKPRTMDDVLRAIPLYADARELRYTSGAETNKYGIDDAAARVDYRVDSTAFEVLRFYQDKLTSAGWLSRGPGNDLFLDQELTLYNRASYFDGFWFGGDAPWIHVLQHTLTYGAHIQAIDERRDGRWITVITIVVSPSELGP
jgi:hypothetical protein